MGTAFSFGPSKLLLVSKYWQHPLLSCRQADHSHRHSCSYWKCHYDRVPQALSMCTVLCQVCKRTTRITPLLHEVQAITLKACKQVFSAGSESQSIQIQLRRLRHLALVRRSRACASVTAASSKHQLVHCSIQTIRKLRFRRTPNLFLWGLCPAASVFFFKMILLTHVKLVVSTALFALHEMITFQLRCSTPSQSCPIICR